MASVMIFWSFSSTRVVSDRLVVSVLITPLQCASCVFVQALTFWGMNPSRSVRVAAFLGLGVVGVVDKERGLLLAPISFYISPF